MLFSVGRSQSTQNERQKIFEIYGERSKSLGRENIRHSAEIERLTLSLREADMESARKEFNLNWKTRKILGTV